MNREIKYKIWNRKAKDWWNWWTEETYNLKALITGNFEPFTKEDAEECLIPLQYTGLDDKNNVPIYEGDVITVYGDENFVYFQSGAYWVNLDETKGVSLLANLQGEGMKVIGNKFENPNYNT